MQNSCGNACYYRILMENKMSLSRSLFYVALSTLLLSGCNTSTEHLSGVKDSAIKTYNFEQNYRDIYNNIMETGERCSLSQNGFPKMVGELHTAERYGKISRSESSAGIVNYSLLIRIEQISTGSKLTIFSSKNPNADKIFRWAKGDQSCQ